MTQNHLHPTDVISYFEIYNLAELNTLFYGPCQICHQQSCVGGAHFVLSEIEQNLRVSYYYNCKDSQKACKFHVYLGERGNKFEDLSEEFLFLPSKIAVFFGEVIPQCNLHPDEYYFLLARYPHGENELFLEISMDANNCFCMGNISTNRKLRFSGKVPLEKQNMPHFTFAVSIKRTHSLNEEE